MAFATDRDLLIEEPELFTDVPLVSQLRLTADDVTISDTTLTSTSADFVKAQVLGGAVILVANRPLEVLERIDANTLTVSRLRSRRADAALPPGDQSEASVVIRTFEPQIQNVHEELLRKVGIDPDNTDSELTADAIVSASVMARLEGLGALSRIFAGAVAITGDNDELWRKADGYHKRYQRGIERGRVLIDLDGDGRGDIHRHFAVTSWRRV